MIKYRDKKGDEKFVNRDKENKIINGENKTNRNIPSNKRSDLQSKKIDIRHKSIKLLSFWEKLCILNFIPNRAKRNFMVYTNKIFDSMLSIEYILKSFYFQENWKSENAHINSNVI